VVKIREEKQILDKDFRALVLSDIRGNENQERKEDAKKRYEIYKDNVKKYVLESFNEESKDKKADE